MKTTREIVKLNERQSLIEIIYDKKEPEYCVCSYYDESIELGNRWSWGHFFSTLDDALKYAATRCFTPIRKYVLVEVDSCCNINQRTYSTFDEAYEELEKRFKNYSSDEDCFHAEILKDADGSTIAQLWYDGNDDIVLKIIEVVV